MIRFFEFLISLLIVVVIFIVIGLFLPSKRIYSYSIETNRPMTTVNDLFNGFSRFKDWNPLLRYDARAKSEISGPAMGVLFSMRQATVQLWHAKHLSRSMTIPQRGMTASNVLRDACSVLRDE